MVATSALGCASIVSKSDWPVVIDSSPSGAEITVTNSRGQPVFRGRTPTTLTLAAGGGYFQSQSYFVEATLAGYPGGRAALNSRLNYWYAGNVLFGGLIGLLIVDPLTGAMWKLDDRLVVYMGDKDNPSALEPGDLQLRVVTLDQLPAEQRRHLIRVN